MEAQTQIIRPRVERAALLLLAAAVALLFAAFAVIALSSLVSTCSIDPAFYANEEILYTLDNIPLNLLALCGAFALCVCLALRFPRALTRINLRLVAALLLLLVLLLGAAWVMAVDCQPEYDSRYITMAAASASRNDFSPLLDGYFRRFPYQLGYVFLLELQQRLLGAENFIGLGLVNVLCLVGAYAALLCITRRLFSDRRVLFFTLLLLPLFLQGPLFCTFIYGNLPGLCPMLWGVYFVLRFFQTGRARLLLPAAPLLALAVLAKPNYWIAVLACGIAALLHLLAAKRWQGLAAVLLAALLTSGALRGVTLRYERLADTTFGPGTPQTAWLAMGMGGSYMAPGWYNGYTRSILPDNGYDADRARAQIREDLRRNLAKMQDPAYAAAFFGRKLLSQFQETSFESIFVSKDAQNGRPVPAAAEWVYGQGEPGLLRYFDLYMQFVYVFAAAGLFLLLRSLRRARKGFAGRRPSALPEPLSAGAAVSLCVLPVILLGGFLYHMLFEGKSQYILVYIPLLLPYAAFGLSAAVDAAAALLRRGSVRAAE